MINYTYNFDETFNRKKAIEAQTDIGPYGLDLTRDQVMHSLAEDFFFFTPHFSLICKILKIDKETISLIEEILLSYKRCVAVNIQRILIKYSDLFSKREEEY